MHAILIRFFLPLTTETAICISGIWLQLWLVKSL